MSNRPVTTALFLAALLAACSSPGVRLSDADRRDLDGQPAIYVQHYETPLPAVKAGSKAKPPAPAEVRRTVAADPAALIAQGFAHVIGRKEKLRNLHVETKRLAPPVAESATAYKPRHRRGLALDLWVDEWTFAAVADGYAMRLSARARLARIDDGRVLWSSGHCRIGDGGSARETRLTRAELVSGTRLRRVVASARDECVRQLTRDFYETPGKK